MGEEQAKTGLGIVVRGNGTVQIKIEHPNSWRHHRMSIEEFRELVEKGPDTLRRAEEAEKLING